jgi:hypothetical protein
MWKIAVLLTVLALPLAGCGNASDDHRLRGLEERLDRLSRRIESARSADGVPVIEKIVTDGGDGNVILAFWPDGSYHIWHVAPDGSGGYTAKSLGYQNDSEYLRTQ